MTDDQNGGKKKLDQRRHKVASGAEDIHTSCVACPTPTNIPYISLQPPVEVSSPMSSGGRNATLALWHECNVTTECLTFWRGRDSLDCYSLAGWQTAVNTACMVSQLRWRHYETYLTVPGVTFRAQYQNSTQFLKPKTG